MLRCLALVMLASCATPAATTAAPASEKTDVVGAHGYAVPAPDLRRFVEESLSECGFDVTSEDGSVFVAEKGGAFTSHRVLHVSIAPAGDRLRVDVTVTSDGQRWLSHENKEQLYTFYEALDRRAGASR